MKNVHHNVPPPEQMDRARIHRRPTHKQSIAIQTSTDHYRHGLWLGATGGIYKGFIRTLRILQTTLLQ